MVVLGDRPTRPDGGPSFGLEVYNGADVLVERAVLADNTSAGVAVAGGGAAQATRLVLRDVVVRDTRSNEDAEAGYGMVVQHGASVRAERSRFERNRALGLLVLGWGDTGQSALELADVAVVDTRLARCGELPEGEEGSCIEGYENYGSGHGLAVDGVALVRADGFLLSGSARAGLIVGQGTDVRIRRGAITGNAVGVNVMDEDFDVARLTDEVFVFDNRTEWASVALELPQPSESIGALRRPDLGAVTAP